MTRKELFVEQRTTRMLLEVGIPVNLQGFKFLRAAIIEVVKDPELISFVTKRLYPLLAAKFNVSSAVIERSIRHAIEVSFVRKGIEGLNSIFNVYLYDYRYKLSNSELIALLAEKIISELQALDVDDPIDVYKKTDDEDSKNHKKKD